MEGIHMQLFIGLAGTGRFVSKLAMGLSMVFCLTVVSYAQTIATTTTLTATPNPSVINQTMTLTAMIGGGLYAAPFNAGVGRSAGSAVYIRYELVDTTFSRSVAAGDLINLTTPAAFASTVVALGGAIGDKIVVMQITAGAPGLNISDNLRFNFSPGALIAASAIKFSVHETLSSAVGTVPLNVSLVFGPLSALISSLSSPLPFTGNVNFSQNGVTITGCGSVAISSSAALCSTTIGTAGTYTMTADYSGNFDYFPSSGTLTGGQVVGLGITQLTLPNGTVGVAYSEQLSATGGTAPYSFTLSGGTLPNGLALSSTGALTGTPSQAGSFPLTLLATDSLSATGTRSITVVIQKAPQTLSFTLPSTGRVGTSVSLTATASSGLAVTYSATPSTVCTLSGNTLQLIAAGSCFATASQAGSDNYLASAAIQRRLDASTAGPVAPPAAEPIRMRSAAGVSMSARLTGFTLTFTTDNDPGAAFRSVANVDINGNGAKDLVYQNTTQGAFGDVRVWQDFLPTIDRLLRNVKLEWRPEAAGDLDGDGFGDIIWRFTGQTPNLDDTGVTYIWFTNGMDVGQVRKRGGAPLSWQMVGAVDTNRDGAADMIYLSPDQQLRVLMATANRTCANFAAGMIPLGYSPVAVGNFTGGRFGEILLRQAASGLNNIMQLDGGAVTMPAPTANPDDPNASCTATSQAIPNPIQLFFGTDPSWRVYATADLNGDGTTDIVWLRPDDTLTVWLMNRSTGVPAILGNAGTAPTGFNVIQ